MMTYTIRIALTREVIAVVNSQPAIMAVYELMGHRPLVWEAKCLSVVSRSLPPPTGE